MTTEALTTVTVRFFGPAADAAGTDRAEYQLVAPATLDGLRAMILARYPALAAGASSLRFAVNLEFAEGAVDLSDGDEVALIPPVAGGANAVATEPVRILTEPINLTGMIERASDPRAGGVCTFTGTVRAESDGDRQLLALEYSAYAEMAITKLREIRSAALERFDVTEVIVEHRIGRLELGEVSVAIVVAAPHRVDAFDACRSVIDTLKTTVPIWKKEYWSDGETSWVDPTQTTSGES